MIFKTGTSVFVRTVTYHYVGRIVADDGPWLILEDASWVADSGQWSVALAAGRLSVVEPYPDGPVAIAHAAIVDVCVWSHPLPREALE